MNVIIGEKKDTSILVIVVNLQFLTLDQIYMPYLEMYPMLLDHRLVYLIYVVTKIETGSIYFVGNGNPPIASYVYGKRIQFQHVDFIMLF